MNTPVAQTVELNSIEVRPHGESYVLGLLDGGGTTHRMELPHWSVPQLLRMLPHLDNALRQARREIACNPAAEAVARCEVQRVGPEDIVAMRLMSDRGVESVHLLAPDEARALFAALGEALLSPAAVSPAPDRRRETLN